MTSRDGKECSTFLQMTLTRTIDKNHEIQRMSIQQTWANFEKLDEVEWQFVFVVPSGGDRHGGAEGLHTTLRKSTPRTARGYSY